MRDRTEKALYAGVEGALLLFTVCALTLTKEFSAYGYLALLATPLAFLLLVYRYFEERLPFGRLWSSGKSFLSPFLPFIAVFCAIKTYYLGSEGDFVLDYPAICSITVLSTLCYLALSEKFKPSKILFFEACALGSFLYFLDIACTAYYFNVNIWDAKNWVVPYSTTYARCILIPAGLSFLGFFVLSEKEQKTRWCCLISGLLGFISATGFIAVRAVIPAVGVAFFCALLILRFNSKRLSLVPLLASFATLILVLGLASPLPQKIILGFQESVTVVTNNAAEKTLEHLLKEDKNSVSSENKTPPEEDLQKSLNNSMGGRFAVWNLAQIMMKQSPIVGYGDGRPASFVNLKELFKYSTDYLVHFHSDYVQSAMVGGLLLLSSLLITQLCLIWQARKDPLRLYLILSLCSFGIFEIGFLEVCVFSSFMGAWILLSVLDFKITWKYRS